MRKIYGNIEINTDYEYYKYLGVDENATTEEIKKGFENSKAELASASINMTGEDVATSYLLLEQAVKILTDDELRKAYDDLVRETNNHVRKEEVEQLIIDAEKQLEYNRKDELIVQLEEEREKLRKINEANEEYIKELERKLSTSKVEQTIEDYREDDDIKEDDDDIKKTLLDVLNQDGDREIEIIDIKKNNDVSKEVKEESKVEEKPIPVIKIENNNDNTKNNRNDNDIKPIFKDTEEPQRVDEIEEVSKSSEIVEKGLSIGSYALTGLCAVVLLGTAIYAGNAISEKRAKEKLAEGNIDTNTVTASMVGAVNTSDNAEETPVVVEEEPYEVELDINSDTVIYETVDKIENEISKVTDPVVKDMFNRETIEALVRYTRDNTILSGEKAYELFQVLYRNGIDTSIFFENLDSYQVMNTLYLSTKAIDQNNNSYDDENNAYNAINNAVDYLTSDNYAAIWNVSAISDEVVNYRTMIMASGSAVENGLEGSEYQNELNSVPSAVRENAKNVFNKVKPFDNSYFMQLRLNALDNESVRTLG